MQPNSEPVPEPESDLLIEIEDEPQEEPQWIRPEPKPVEPKSLDYIQNELDECNKHNLQLQFENSKKIDPVKFNEYKQKHAQSESNMKTQLDQCTLEKIKLKENSDFYFYLAIGFIFLVVPLFFVFFLYFMKSTTN